MKVLVLYRPNSEYARMVEEYAHDFKYGHPNRMMDLLSLDTRDGAATATLYDVVQYPAVLAMSDDGQLLKLWQGDKLPPMNELAYYAQR